MTGVLPLRDHATRDDLRIFLERLARVGEPEVRLVTRGSTVAVYGCTQAPRGIADRSPLVLAMRAFSLAEEPESTVDVTVMARSLLDRIARLGMLGLMLDVPDVTVMAAWTGMLPPTAGWEPRGTIDSRSIADVAKAGIERVATMMPKEPGEAVVHTVRTAVWGQEMVPGIPAGAGFALEALGFLGDDPVRIASSASWTRLTTERGYAIVR